MHQIKHAHVGEVVAQLHIKNIYVKQRILHFNNLFL